MGNGLLAARLTAAERSRRPGVGRPCSVPVSRDGTAATWTSAAVTTGASALTSSAVLWSGPVPPAGQDDDREA
ncbi:hypothetical protein C1701_23505 [Actinoalloteichus sp. AHMU CJ021]|nr:hypothetical protein C1701_23505 [Actinoalloteichus sp. AHMU CJ021]